ncbi:MAG: EamA family transporter RarD, partial [Xanthomonadales bacterium]|nr:EamA family transporter RarD [Xanthomonadales bacterium]
MSATPGNAPTPAPVLPADAPAGLVYASLAYAGWGLLPLYFQLLAFLGPVEIVIHRVLFSLLLLLPLALWLGRPGWIGIVGKQPKVLALYALTAVLIANNWLIFVWAVNSQQVVEASLGYFINPIVVVLAGA